MGDPSTTDSGRQQTSVWGLQDPAKRFFKDEISDLGFDRRGLVASANISPDLNASSFFITLTEKPIESMFKKHTIFGEVAEGIDVLDKINAVYVTKSHRPLQNIRIKHTIVIVDPFEGKEQEFGLLKFNQPSRSPSPLV
jgi:peptidyl-prolyl cis-trans isomerase-like 4